MKPKLQQDGKKGLKKNVKNSRKQAKIFSQLKNPSFSSKF